MRLNALAEIYTMLSPIQADGEVEERADDGEDAREGDEGVEEDRRLLTCAWTVNQDFVGIQTSTYKKKRKEKGTYKQTNITFGPNIRFGTNINDEKGTQDHI